MAEEGPERENVGLVAMDSSESRWVFQDEDDSDIEDDEDLPQRMGLDYEEDENGEQRLIRTGPRIDSFDVDALDVPGASRNDYEMDSHHEPTTGLDNQEDHCYRDKIELTAIAQCLRAKCKLQSTNTSVLLGLIAHTFCTVGAPLGFYGAWPAFALIHHLMIWYVAAQVYPGVPFTRYTILGDDIVIGDERVAGRPERWWFTLWPKGKAKNHLFKYQRRMEKKDFTVGRNIILAFQTLGVVFGDVGTSPLYTFSVMFSKCPINGEEDVLGGLSLVLYTIILIPLIKYVFVVLWANDDGEGGTFALYSLICRHAKVSLIPNQLPSDARISSFRLKVPSPELERSLKIKERLETSLTLKKLLLMLVLVGTSMVIADGIVTPAMSVMSAVSGLKVGIAGVTQGDIISC
ncbi:hypothetical protein HHK36_009474 [Tetracentron sinense]|uniref:K+ potassium transporter integral membrane domain-containing protein n=1 Tax=Tetracentron sinense TaxID=13715 RepID=A0A834ZLE6_TETSI|nr:hypothetical protein HHK36_009474 [Tetracentron sinense]